MQFGEIVEPSTRALIEDDYEGLTDDCEFNFQWIGSEQAPSDLNVLIFLESKKILKIFSKCVINALEPNCELRNCGVKVYRIACKNDTKQNVSYLVLYDEQQETKVSCGQIVEVLSHWISKARQIITITSAPLATYQNLELTNNFETCVRVLNTKSGKTFSHKKLESPNIISGLGACVLSYCIHMEKECSSFIAYMDSSPIDSINSRPIISLAEKLNLPLKLAKITCDIPSNLYM